MIRLLLLVNLSFYHVSCQIGSRPDKLQFLFFRSTEYDVIKGVNQNFVQVESQRNFTTYV